ncbi:hypothetical protein [Aneurinibacillus tyrosinisolvens]|uniref:hypothetical protein n=1 Tax=Aneurinibacillus tyrosinisolvens TaxID=1443435 RepID=UPI00063F04D5|nr:hypothetical protein [Aneurinibacillus tyrosinisolvens]
MIGEVGKVLLFVYFGFELLTSILLWFKNRKYSYLVYATKDAKELFSIANQLSTVDIPFRVRFHNHVKLDLDKSLETMDKPFMRCIYVEKRNLERALDVIDNQDKEQK